MRRVAAQKQAMVKRAKHPFPTQQPVPPIGGFPTINRTAFLRGMARKAGLMKGDPGPNVKLKAPKMKKMVQKVSRVAQHAPNAAAGVTAGGGSMTKGAGKGPGR